MGVLFVGLGTMGQPMVKRLSSSFEVTVYDIDGDARRRVAAELGVPELPDLGDVPASIDTVVLMLPSSTITESVLTGASRLLNRIPAGGLIIDMTSSEPASTRSLARVAASRGVAYVDAPVSGGRQRAESGELAIMVGADASAYLRAHPILETMGARIVHVGGPGAGGAAKALNNLLSATHIAAASEVLTAAAKLGIDPAIMLEVLNSSTGRSQATEVKFPEFVLSGSFASGFGMDLMLKDLGIARRISEEAGVYMPVTGLAREITENAREGLEGSPDHTEVVRYYEARNGVTLRA